MKLVYWTNFSKRKNSTKQPSGGTEIDVVLKDNTSLLNPIFQTGSVPANVNYCYVADFGRYYYVSGVSHDGPFCLIECECDVLATYKSQIGSYTAYIERSSSSYDLNVSDALIKSTTQIVQSAITEGNQIGGDYDYYGTLVCMVVGKTGMKKFSLSLADLAAVFNSSFDATLSAYLDTTNPFNTVENALQGLFCSMANPAQYVKSVRWFPMSLSSGSGEIPYFGFVGATASRNIVKDTAEMGCAISKPARYYNDFRDFDSRFTSCTIFLPGVGSVPLDPKYLQSSALSCTYYCDINTGACDVELFANQSEIGHFSCQVGIDVPIGGTAGFNPVSQMFNAGLSALNMNPMGIIGNLRDAITQTLQPPVNTTGASGNQKIWDARPFVQISVTRLGSTGLPTSQLGREKAAPALISSLSGYVQCSGASVDIPGYSEEKDRVNGYLNGGFFYE